MGTKTILILIAVGVVAIIVIALVFFMLSNQKKKKLLMDNLDKIKKEKQLQNTGSVTYTNTAQGEISSKEKISEQIEHPMPEMQENVQDQMQENDVYNRREERYDMPYPRMPDRQFTNSGENQIDRDKEFDDFLNEHAYSRKIFDKTLLDKIREMPPEMKAMLLGSIFDKFGDDK